VVVVLEPDAIANLPRCTTKKDGVLADATVHLPVTHAVVVEAINPFTIYGTALHATRDAPLSGPQRPGRAPG
jgi:hypothetical protein